MENNTIGDITRKVEQASSDFERTNTELKRKYLIWNIEAFNAIAKTVHVSRGSFGTGYPFYALDEKLQGKLPIIEEQIRYNRKLVRDGEKIQKSIWLCESCLARNYDSMPDLKVTCRPCPITIDKLKPRRILNRLPDLDMWLVCEDGLIEQAQIELNILLEKFCMHTSDINPIKSIEDVSLISQLLKSGTMPNIFLPIDFHIIEYSNLEELIRQVPAVLAKSKDCEINPFLPIQPKSYRKKWQYDDEAYNFIFDFLVAFTPFNFPEELQEIVEEVRLELATTYTPEELFNLALQGATQSSINRFASTELEEIFINRIKSWQKIQVVNQDSLEPSNIKDEQNTPEI